MPRLTLRRLGNLIALALLVVSPSAAQEVVVSSTQPTPAVKIFDLEATGNVAPAREISGAATGLVLSFSTLIDPRRREIFVADLSGQAIRVYPLDADGDVPPLREIAGDATQLGQPFGLAIDPFAGELFVKPFGSSTVVVFPLTASGNVPPSRVLTSSVPLGGNSRGLALDLRHGEIFVTVQQAAGAVLVFPIGASGLTEPTRTLSGAATHLVQPLTLALDPPHDEMFVIADNQILTFGRGQSGNVPPSRIFTFSITLGTASGLHLDAYADELVISGQSSSGHILAFDRTTNGFGMTPLRDITGPATGLAFNGLLSVSSRPLFADGVDDGTTDAWSTTVP
jgi:hypothetical protein